MSEKWVTHCIANRIGRPLALLTGLILTLATLGGMPASAACTANTAINVTGGTDLAVAAEFDNNDNGPDKLTTTSTGMGSSRTIYFATVQDTDNESIPMTVVFTGANLGSDEEEDITIDITDDEYGNFGDNWRGRWTLSVQEGFDVPDADGMILLTVDGGAVTVGAEGDWASHWLKVALEAGQEYRLSADGSDGDAGALDPEIWSVFTAGGEVLDGSLSGFKLGNDRVTFVAPEDDEYYVMVQSDPWTVNVQRMVNFIQTSRTGTMDVSIEEI